MTTEQRATTCGLAEGVGCRGIGVGRAEAFARSLHHKLRSLGGSAGSAGSGNPARPDSPDDMDESWSSAPSGPSSQSGPVPVPAGVGALRTLSASSASVDSSSELFYDLDFSPQSPQEEVTSQELAGMMAGSANRDDLLGPQSPQSDCSSDYFDTVCFDEDRGPAPAPAADGHDGSPPAALPNGVANGEATHVNGHGSAPKPKRPWNRVPHKFKAGTPEAMSEVSALTLDDVDDDEDKAEQPRAKTEARTSKGLAKLNFAKSSQTLLQEGLIEQLKQGHDIPPELKNGLCPSGPAGSSGPCGEVDVDVPVAGSRGLAAMKQVARTLDALETPDSSTTPATDVTQDLSRLQLGGEDTRPDDGSLNLAADCAECQSAEDETAVRDAAADESCHNGHGEDHTDGERDADAEDEEDRRPRIRRCSSLKTGKTPPGTPGRKKIVRFADVLGLDLADVRTFLDEIPKVPTSAYSDLQDVDPTDPVPAALAAGCLPSGLPQLALAFSAVPAADGGHGQQYGGRPHVTRVLVPLFQQPGGLADFMDRVRDRQVCMENAVVADAALLSIAGQVRVRNLDFHKTVHIRYTTDGWRNFADLQATYVPNSCDGFSDKFTFTLFAGHTMSVGQRLEMAVRFQCKGQQYWDSNSGANYCFQCLPPSGVPPALPSLSMSMPALNSPHDDGWKFLF